jgi:hypothetical protein
MEGEVFIWGILCSLILCYVVQEKCCSGIPPEKSAEPRQEEGQDFTSLVNPNIPRLGSWFVKDLGNHTTGCYGTNFLEAMPEIYICNLNVKDKMKLKIKPGWVENLPVAIGQWGFGREHTMDAHVCVRKGVGWRRSYSRSR